MTSEELLQQLENKREELNLSIVEFCQEIGIGKAAYYNWKKGAAPSAVEYALKILNFLENN